MTPEQKLEKLKQLLEVANQDFATPDDLMRVSKACIEVIDKLRTSLETEIGSNKTLSERSIRSLRDDLGATEDRLNKIIDELESSITRDIASKTENIQSTLQAEIKRVESKIPQKTDLSGLIQEIDDIRKSLPDFATLLTKEPQAVRDALELLQGDERLAIEAIKDLREELDELKKIRSTERIIQAGVTGRDIIKDIDLSSQLDGVKKTFSIPSTYNIISVVASSYPTAFRKNIDFTWNSTSITFTSEIDAASTLATGQTLILTVVTG